MGEALDERYGVSDDEVDIERVRLAMLAEALDPRTFRLLERVGVEPGMHVLELGAGTGSVSAWLAERVGPTGRVMSTDIDLRFHGEMPPNVIVREHDVTRDPLPAEHFHLVDARAVIQHLPERVDVLARLCRALRPGGAMVIEDGTMDYLLETNACVCGDPDRAIEMFRAYEATGCDMVFCLFNPYKVPHDKVMQTIELIGAHVIPEFG